MVFWYILISRKATVPGRCLLLTPDGLPIDAPYRIKRIIPMIMSTGHFGN